MQLIELVRIRDIVGEVYMNKHISLGVNIDHIATLRNARGGVNPDPVAAARLLEGADSDFVTVHLREDRRHILDEDVMRLVKEISLPMNLEMAATDEMVAFALVACPYSCCIVPERREELTTEAGLDVVNMYESLSPKIKALKQADILVSLFISSEIEQLRAAHALGISLIEFNTGTYCDYHEKKMFAERDLELTRLAYATKLANELDIKVHAGHGLNYETVGPVVSIPALSGVNIGHFLIGEAIFTGLVTAVKQMRQRIDSVKSRS